MFTIKKPKIVITGLLFAFIFLATACGATTTTSANQGLEAQATLNHVPSGTGSLTWNAASQTLTVTLWISGLSPNSSHPAHIHKGNCNSDGDIVYSLNPVKADASGLGTSQTVISNDAKAIPQNSWYINVHNGGTGLTPALQDDPIACGNIVNNTPSTTQDQTVQMVLAGTSTAEQSATGITKLSLDGSTLTVQLVMGGLVPGSKHMAHIHAGSCESEGGVVYPLNTVVADANGIGTSTTTINQVNTIPASGWYVNVHLGATMQDLGTQTGDDPISCGNVVVLQS